MTIWQDLLIAVSLSDDNKVGIRGRNSKACDTMITEGGTGLVHTRYECSFSLVFRRTCHCQPLVDRLLRTSLLRFHGPTSGARFATRMRRWLW